MAAFQTPIIKVMHKWLTITTLLFLISGQAHASWIEQGPGPILHNGNVNIPPNNPVVGAINAIVVDPKNSNVVYAGTVNGGVWKTRNANDLNPKWKPLTDEQLPGLSIRSLAISPVDRKILFAGTGQSSSLRRLGLSFGVARSLDGGVTWEVMARKTFNGRPIVSIVPTELENGQVVLAATWLDNGGVYRSIDGGVSFKRISNNGESYLPDQGVSSLIADPSDPLRFYAAVPVKRGSVGEVPGNEGIYRSDDGGLTWNLVNTGLTSLRSSNRILLAIHNNSERGTNAVYAMVLTADNRLAGVFRSEDQGENWTSMAPLPNPFPGGQGEVHASIVADPKDPNVVFIGGDRQDGPFPNPNGCNTFAGNLFRGDASLLPNNPWQVIVCNGANGTAPHPDSRWMVFDHLGNILQADDGGIYKLEHPNNPTLRRWVSLNGNIRPCEMHSVAYDSLSKIVFGGTQDNGTPYQLKSGDFTWDSLLNSGDGGIVAVDNDQVAHPGTSIRYSSFQFLRSFNRSSWDANNKELNFVQIKLLITSGPGTGSTIFDFDNSIQFYTRYILNKIIPSRMLIGTTYLYESLDMGDTVSNLGLQSQVISALAYGGRLNGIDQPDVFYVGTVESDAISFPLVLHRVNVGGPITVLSNYPGGSVRSIVMDPENYRHVFIADTLGHVWASFDEGQNWEDLTRNLSEFVQQNIRVLEAFYLKDSESGMKLVAGGQGGVFILEHIKSKRAKWKKLNKGLPHGLVFDLHFDTTDQLLVTSLLGRGAWILPLPSEKALRLEQKQNRKEEKQ